MRGFSFAAVSLLTLSVAARPTVLEARGDTCLTDDDAYALANAFGDLISKPFNETLASDAFTSGFQDYSDSVAELINAGCPTGNATLTAPTFASRAAFIAGQSGQQPIPFTIFNIWNNCNSITVRWRSSDPGDLAPSGLVEVVTGILVLEVVPSNNSDSEFAFQIKRTFSEFNSGAWLYNLVCVSDNVQKYRSFANIFSRRACLYRHVRN